MSQMDILTRCEILDTGGVVTLLKILHATLAQGITFLGVYRERLSSKALKIQVSNTKIKQDKMKMPGALRLAEDPWQSTLKVYFEQVAGVVMNCAIGGHSIMRSTQGAHIIVLIVQLLQLCARHSGGSSHGNDGEDNHDVCLFACSHTGLELASVRTVEYLVAAAWNCSFCSRNCASLREASAIEALQNVSRMKGIPHRLSRLCTRICDKINES
jgi:hypothetical protein